MTKIELSNEFNVAKKLMLALHLIVAVLVGSVLLALVLGLLLERLEVILLEDLLIHRATVIE